MILSIADSFPGKTAAKEAVATVEKIARPTLQALLESHRDVVARLLSQELRLDSRSQAGKLLLDPVLQAGQRLAPAPRVPVDLLGPWYRRTGWPRIWWNLNIETLYLPVYTGNRLELGESFINFIDAKRANFYRNAKEIWGFDDCATVPHTTCYEGLRGDGIGGAGPLHQPRRLHLGAAQLLSPLPLLHGSQHGDRSVEARLLSAAPRQHQPLPQDPEERATTANCICPTLHSPEYGDDADNNYNLSLLRWGCQTLIELNERYELNDPLVPTWQQTLDDLVPYPVDENGLRIGANISFTKSHRHWSHILMVHPLHIMTGDQPENRELLEKSVLHWLTVDNSRGINGWSRAAAASLYATLGDGDNAIKQIHGHMADKRFVRPNTMYIEGSPVIECSIVLNRSLQDMLLQSWGDKIAVFPAIPKAWDSAVFHDLRAEGAFLVSAERKGGKTAWVRIKSLAGEPCRVQPNTERQSLRPDQREADRDRTIGRRDLSTAAREGR